MEVGGFHEIQQRRARYRIVDRDALAEALGMEVAHLAEAHRAWVEDALRSAAQPRQPQWTESVAVGGRPFVEAVQRALGDRGRHREIKALGDAHVLHDPAAAYGTDSPFENGAITTN